MDQKVKEYADAMEAGWKKCPHMSRMEFYVGNSCKPDACCGNGHAALGLYGDASKWHVAEELIEHIRVQKRGGENVCGEINLSNAIDLLAIAHWTTPELVAWIRSH
jgi:hypothetical protein